MPNMSKVTHPLMGKPFQQGRIVAVQEPTPNLKGYVWVERKLPDGSAIEREMFFFDELPKELQP